MKNTLILNLFTLFTLLMFSNSAFSQNYWQQEINYTISVKLDDKNHTLTGFEEFEYVNHSPNELTEIYMHLWPNAYRNVKTALGKQLYNDGNQLLKFGADSLKGSIDSIDFKLNGNLVSWEYDPKNMDICVIHLPVSLKPGERVSVSTPFFVQIPSGEISRLGHIGQSYQITQWYPKPAVYDKNGWNPIPYLNQGEFYSDFGTFDVSITLPENYVVGATGDLQTASEVEFLESKLTETEEWYNKNPNYKKPYGPPVFPASSTTFKTIRYTQQNIHDFAWFADKRYLVQKGEVELPHSKRKVTSWAMFTPQNARLWKKAIEYINDGTYYYSLWNGDYPYKQVTAVDGTISAGGGMEYPNVTVIGNTGSAADLEIVIVHEVGHNWFYGILGTNERVHGWMDEGINTLNEMRYMETKYPDNTYFSDMLMNGKLHFDHLSHHDMGDYMYQALAASGDDQPIETHSADFTSANYGGIMYQKTGLVFLYLKGYLGDTLFNQCAQAYFERWKFKHPQPEDMKAVFEEISGKKLDWLFGDLIQTTNHVDYKLKQVHAKNGQTTVTVKNVGQVNGPISVNVFKDNQLTETAWIEPGTKRKSSVVLNTAQPDEVQIDANHTIPEIYRHNNNWHASGLFKKAEHVQMQLLIGKNESDKSTIFWTPIVAGNRYDKLMIGAAFHNLSVPINRFQYLIAPMYSFGRQSVSGISEFSYTFLPENTIKLSRFGLSIKSFKNDSSSVLRKQDGAYLAFSPYWYATLGNRRKAKPFTHSVLVQGIANYAVNRGLNEDYYGGFGQYTLKYERPDHKLKLNLRAEGVHATTADFVRFTIDGTYKYRYLKNKMKRWVELRLFAGDYGYFKAVNGTDTYRYGMSLSGTDGTQDLFLEDYYFARNAASGFFSQQRDENMGGFKSTSTYGTTTHWMTSGNIYFQLPIPKMRIFGLFADAGAFYNGVSVNTALNTGVAVRFGNVFGLYFPVWMSEELNDSFGNAKYGEKIRFTLHLNLVNKGVIRPGNLM